MDPAAEFPEANDGRTARQEQDSAVAAGRKGGSKRKVTFSLSLEVRQSWPRSAPPQPRNSQALPPPW